MLRVDPASPCASSEARAETSASPRDTPGLSSCGLDAEGTAAGVRDTRPAEGADRLWGGGDAGAGTLQRGPCSCAETGEEGLFGAGVRKQGMQTVSTAGMQGNGMQGAPRRDKASTVRMRAVPCCSPAGLTAALQLCCNALHPGRGKLGGTTASRVGRCCHHPPQDLFVLSLAAQSLKHLQQHMQWQDSSLCPTPTTGMVLVTAP